MAGPKRKTPARKPAASAANAAPKAKVAAKPGGSSALNKARATVARLEKDEAKKKAIATAEAGLTAAKAALAKAKRGR